jgi:hypothetical protein
MATKRETKKWKKTSIYVPDERTWKFYIELCEALGTSASSRIWSFIKNDITLAKEACETLKTQRGD